MEQRSLQPELEVESGWVLSEQLPALRRGSLTEPIVARLKLPTECSRLFQLLL